MKRFTIVVFALGFVSFFGGMAASGQGRGNGGPAGSAGPAQGHGSQTSHGGSHETKPTKEPQREANFEGRIEQNPQLKAKLTGMLPAGMSLQTAASGFKNQGQFIAALHVSKNLNISFDDLKARMTGQSPVSLGQAIHDLKPALPQTAANKEAEKAEEQAKATQKVKAIS